MRPTGGIFAAFGGLLVASAVAAGCGSKAKSSALADTPWEPCPGGFRDECASLMMPLDWSAPGGSQIPVFVSRAKAYGTSKADLWLVQGGPGDSADAFGAFVDELRATVPGFDIYTIEHRGVGESARLGCPDQESPSSDEGTNISLAEVPACLAAVQAQWPDGLKNFRLTSAASDLAHAIDRTRTPGRPVFVYGVSYGTAVAIRYLQLRPDDAAGVVLDSVAPPGIAFFSDFDAQYDTVLHSLADLCAADPACVAHVGADPWAVLSRVTGEVLAGACPGAGLTRGRLSEDVQALLERDDFRVVALALLRRVDRCGPQDLAAIAAFENTAQELLASSPSPRQSQVLYWNVVSSDLWESPAPTVDAVQARCDALSICGGGMVSNAKVRALWPSFDPDPLDAKPQVTTSSAVLVLDGTLDPQTPFAHAAAFAAGLSSPHKTFVALPFSAHDTVNQAVVVSPDDPPCGYQLLQSFLAHPDAPDASCVGLGRPVSFEPGPDVAQTWFGVDDFWGDAPAEDAGTPGDDAGD
jgi:pimeloyl-ACP methyl ester carboxylesterase